jgi:uncharacterized glyoxalase superfamily protein PhnB
MPERLENSILFASARASVHFALASLEGYQGHLRAKSSFVDPQGEIMHWHEFGDLEGPGWAANTLGGAILLYRWGAFTGEWAVQTASLALVDHVLEDGFLTPEGFIYPYYELAQQRFCLNYAHNDDWLAPGSLAKIGVQMLELAALLPAGARVERLRSASLALAGWLRAHTPLLPSGWVPRRITRDGQAFDRSPTGGVDAIYDHSADGLFLLELYSRLAAQGLGDFRADALDLGETFIALGGVWGSINHDTYDDHESVAYSCAFRILNRAALELDRPTWKEFAYTAALSALERFRMHENRNGVATRGLLYMEDTWDTAYLWENAEAAHAFLEAWFERGDEAHRDTGLGILRAIANHHHGDLGFLTEGVDWNNHVSERHHVDGVYNADINYTEPLLNNLHLVGATLAYFEKIGFISPLGLEDAAAIAMLNTLNSLVPQASPAAKPFTIVDLNYITLYQADLEAALAFYQQVFGPPDSMVEEGKVYGWRMGATWLTLFAGEYGTDPGGSPRNTEFAIQVSTADEVDELFISLLSAGAKECMLPQNTTMYVPMRFACVDDPFGARIDIICPTEPLPS